MACGVNAGIDTVFVLSGEGTMADIDTYQIHPTWVYPDIGTLYRELEETV
ncbi:MAG: HAD hydrolase-like protein [Oscillospiraceae bacterium]|mgnify:FL=1